MHYRLGGLNFVLLNRYFPLYVFLLTRVEGHALVRINFASTVIRSIALTLVLFRH